MIKRIIGYIMIATSCLGYIFFGHYHGSLIPLPTLWFYLSYPIGIIGIILSLSKTNKQEEVTKIFLQNQEQLRQTGQKIVVNIDCCDFKINDFSEEVQSKHFLSVRAYDALYDPSQNIVNHDVNQIVIVYNHTDGEKVEKFISPIFSIDEVTLKFHIMNNDLSIYMDKFDKKRYFFDLKNQ